MYSTCSLKTEALMVMPIEQFFVLMANDTLGSSSALVSTTSGSSGSSVLTYTWQTYAVEYASTAPASFASGVDTFTSRVTPSKFQVGDVPSPRTPGNSVPRKRPEACAYG